MIMIGLTQRLPFASLDGALLWFHPLMWLAARKLRAECERACGDLVLECGVRASDYAEDLLRFLVARATPSAALSIARRSELEDRVRAIFNEKANRQPISRRVIIVVALAGVIATTALASLRASNPPAPKLPDSPTLASSATPPRPRPVERVAALCVDADGKPIPGAEVHLFQYVGTAADGHYSHSGPFASDENGRAVCSDEILYDSGNYDRWFYARVPNRLVGAGRSAKWTNRAAFNTEGRVVMQASRSIEGKVTVPEGFDPRRVTVLVRSMHIHQGPGDMNFDSFPREEHFPGLDTALPEIFECRPDSDGRIRLDDGPMRGRLYLVTRGAGLGEAQWSNSQNLDARFDRPIELTIEEEGLLSGRILTPEGKPAGGMKVTARLSVFGRRQNIYLSSFHAVTDGNGAFAIHGLPETEFDLKFRDPKRLWTFRPLEKLLVRARQDPGLKLTMEKGVRVSGRVLNTDGQPVEGAAISAVADKKGGPGLSDDTTSASGRYEFLLPAGHAYLYFNSLPDGYAYPNPLIVKHLEIKPGEGDIQDLNFTLQRRKN
jgi:hypothetical protein